jgi:integrase/recombinase XerD
MYLLHKTNTFFATRIKALTKEAEHSKECEAMEDQLLAFLKFLQQEYKYSSNTIAAYKNDLGQFVAYLQKNNSNNVANWQTIGADKINGYVTYMKEQPYASSSVARKVAAVKSFFNYLETNQLIQENPTTDIDSPKVKKRLPKTLSAKEVELLLAAPASKKSPKNLRDMALLNMLYSTGMRVTEVVSLRLKDIDLENNVLYCPGKDDQVRELPFDQLTKTILANYIDEGRPFLVKDKDETAMFLNHRGQQLTRQGLWLIIKAYAKEADLSVAVTPHTLRHSFAAHKLNSGSELQEVQKLLGHANISTTQIYTQLEDTETAK